MRSPLLYCLAACAALWSLGAPAQVMRCTDPRTGQVTYTDGNCAGGAQTREIEARKTPEEIRAEREQAAEAIARKQQRLQAEATEQLREESRQRAARAAAPAPDYAHSAACIRSRRSVDVALSRMDTGSYDDQLRLQALQRQMNLDCLGPDRYAQIEAAAPAPPVPTWPVYSVPRRSTPVVTPPQPPAPITQCNVFRCYDSRGGVHPR